jgi:hypothetical protein
LQVQWYFYNWYKKLNLNRDLGRSKW